MRQLFKGLALFVAIVCLVWLGVLWHWQSTRRDMSVDDIVIYLGVLPVVLFLLVLLGRWALRAAQAGAARREAARAAALAAAASAAAPGAPASPGSATSGEAERASAVQLLAASLQCAAGSRPDEVAGALASGEPRPAADRQLRNDEGLPVICARIASLQPDDLSPSLQPALQAVWAAQPDAVGQAPDAAVGRALAALAPALQSSLGALLPWQALFTPPAAEGPAAARVRPSALRVLAAWPAHWSGFDKAVARAWLRACVAEHTPDLPPAQLHWMPDSAATGAALWQEADRLLLTMARERHLDAVLLLACQSDLSEARIQQLEREGQLFSATQPKAGLPGESAAALLLAPANWPAAPDAETPPPRLHRPALVPRDKSVDAPGRVSHAFAHGTLQQALAGAGVAAAEVGAIVSDADQHSGRATELFGAMLAELPHLDAAEDTWVTGPLLGRHGPVAPLITVALAAARAERDQTPVVALSVDDPLLRLALVARPGLARMPSALTAS